MDKEVHPGSHTCDEGREADVLLVVGMPPEFFNRLLVAGNAFAASMDAEVALSDFCRSLMHTALVDLEAIHPETEPSTPDDAA